MTRAFYISLCAFALSACIPSGEPIAPQVDTTAAEDLPPPIPEDKQLYDTYCGFCHGYEGEGYLADNANALGNQRFLESVTDPFLETAIIHGRPGTPMAAWGINYGGPLTQDNVEAIVGYIRKWQTSESLELSDDPVEGNALFGESLFKSFCASCHGICIR